MNEITVIIALVTINTPIYFFLFNIQRRITKIETQMKANNKKENINPGIGGSLKK